MNSPCYTLSQHWDRDLAIQNDADADTEAARQEADSFSFGPRQVQFNTRGNAMTDAQLTKDCKVKHTGNGTLYLVTEECAHAKINDHWEAVVIYKKLDADVVYVRERDDFLDTFELVLEETA